MRYLALCSVFLLAGCECMFPFVKKVDTVDVPVIYAQPCISEDQIPILPKTVASKNGNMVQDSAAASRDARLYKQAAEHAVALLKVCSEKQ